MDRKSCVGINACLLGYHHHEVAWPPKIQVPGSSGSLPSGSTRFSGSFLTYRCSVSIENFIEQAQPSSVVILSCLLKLV
jgi:hypothetical protein